MLALRFTVSAYFFEEILPSSRRMYALEGPDLADPLLRAIGGLPLLSDCGLRCHKLQRGAVVTRSQRMRHAHAPPKPKRR